MEMLEGSDEAAVREARAGNADAFRLLVERHSRSIYRVSFRMTGNQHDAEDLVQETFLRASQQLRKFDGRASFKTWLYRIAFNCSVDLLRAKKGRREDRQLEWTASGDEHEEHPLDRVAATNPSPERLSHSREIARLLGPAMAQLSQTERAAFVLRHHEGWSLDEIGRALGVHPNAAKHSVFRAVQKLRRALEPSFAARGREPVR